MPHLTPPLSAPGDGGGDAQFPAQHLTYSLTVFHHASSALSSGRRNLGERLIAGQGTSWAAASTTRRFKVGRRRTSIARAHKKEIRERQLKFLASRRENIEQQH